MWMSQMGLNFNLSSQLVLHVGLLKLRFEKNLESHNKFGPFLSGQIDIAKFALAQRSANFKVTQLPAIFLVTLRKIRMDQFLQHN